MKEHSPLPWACVYGTDGKHLIFAEDGPIATVAVRMDADEQQANADLLLGAPALLQTIKDQRCSHCGYFFGVPRSVDVGDPACATCAPVVAAIAKAEGR